MRAIALAVLLVAGCASTVYRSELVERVRNGGDHGETASLVRSAPYARGLEAGDCVAIYRSTMSAVEFSSVSTETTVDIVRPVSSADAGDDRADADATIDRGGLEGDQDGAGADVSSDKGGLEGGQVESGADSRADRGGGSSNSAAGSADSSADSGSRGSETASGSRDSESASGSSDSGTASGSNESTSASGSHESATTTASRDSDSASATHESKSDSGSRDASATDAGTGSETGSSSTDSSAARAHESSFASNAGISGEGATADNRGSLVASSFDARTDQPHLVITKTATPAEAFYGEEVVFRIRIRNDSILEIEDILVVDHLDGWFEFEDLEEGDEVDVISAPGGTGTLLVFELPDILEPGETWTTMVTVSVRMP